MQLEDEEIDLLLLNLETRDHPSDAEKALFSADTAYPDQRFAIRVPAIGPVAGAGASGSSGSHRACHREIRAQGAALEFEAC